MIDIRLPQITGATEREQLSQVKSYLYQLAEQLQWALKNTDASNNTVIIRETPKSLYSASSLTPKDAEATFVSIKALIIKSAEIVNAYYDEINRRLEGVYVAQSDFGAFAEKTSQAIEETSTSTTQRFENIQVIINNQGSAIESANGEISNVKGSIQTIGEDLSYQQRDILTIKENVEGISSDIVNLEVNIGDLDVELQETTENLSKNINDTKTELVDDIDSAKEELTGSIDNVKTNLEGSIDNAVANANDLADAAEAAAKGYTDDKASTLAGQIGETASDLKGQIVDTNSRIDDANGAIEDLGTGLEDTKKRLDGAEGALEATKSALSSSIQKVADSVSATDKLLESAKAQLKGSIDDLTVIVTGLKQTIIGVEAYLKSGLLYYTDAGIPVYGLEIGQTVEVDGTNVFNKYARFTSEKLSFYDQNGIEVAYISDKKLYIKMAHITVSLQLGGIIQLVMSNGDVVKKWVGTGG